MLRGPRLQLTILFALLTDGDILQRNPLMQTTIADVILTHMDTLASQLTHVVPWVKHLSDDERAEFLADLAQACVHVRHTGQRETLVEVFEDWEATAQCVGDKQLTDRLLASMADQDYAPR